MILCVDTKALKTSPDVQRDVNLEDLINNHTKYYDTVEEAVNDNYVPLDFSVSTRTMYSNLVLQIDKTDDGVEQKRYYTNLTNVQKFVHKGYDLIMYLTSIGLMHSIDYKFGFDQLMTSHSQFMPIGLYNPDSAIINPIIYCHVLISDEGAKELPNYLKGDRELVPISQMCREGNISALIDTIIEVKEDSKDECNDN